MFKLLLMILESTKVQNKHVSPNIANAVLGAGFRVLVGCEESQEVTKAFRNLGIEAYSCDLQECSGGHPEWHLQMSVFDAIELIKPKLAIFHPPCTFMSRAGARWMYPTAGNICPERLKLAMEAKEFFMNCLNVDIEFIAVENPLPLKVVGLPKETQVIQPYEYGHEYSKRTHLWLKNLPKLKPTDIKENYVPYLPSNTGGAKRGQKATYKSITQKESSKTFQGVAKAMANQWSVVLTACT
ncbi:MAG: DNA cytosine methyltransferase [Bacteroidia bacterium]